MISHKRSIVTILLHFISHVSLISVTLSCDLIKTSSGSKSQLQGNTAGGSNGASFAPPGGDYVVGDPESIRAFNQWTDRERALMIVSADNGIYYGQNPMNPRGLPYVKVQRDSADVREYLQIHPRQDAIQRQYKKLSHKFSADQCSQDILIPYHPDTKSQHYRIEMLKKQGKIVDFQNGGKGFYDGLAGFNSMSRSLFVLNDNGNDGLPILFSLKVGSDTVMGTYQSEKLNNVHWNARYVNSLSEPTSIHELAEDSGIGLVSDSVGLVYGGDYGAVLRDYSLLVAEKDYFFMPLMSFQEKLIKKNSPSSQEDTYFWNIYKPARLNIYDKNSKILRVVLTRSQVEKLIDELAVEMGKLIAIYYLNGISSIDLHGQNLMVGIPLNPDRQGMVAVRDISDNWVFNYAPTNYAQLKYGAIPEPNWCQALYGSQAEGQEACVRKVQKLTLQAFESMAQKLNFKPEERKFSDFNNTKEIYEHLLAKPDKYKEQIINTRKIFKTNRLPAAKTRLNVRCLRSVGCPYARATVTP